MSGINKAKVLFKTFWIFIDEFKLIVMMFALLLEAVLGQLTAFKKYANDYRFKLI